MLPLPVPVNPGIDDIGPGAPLPNIRGLEELGLVDLGVCARAGGYGLSGWIVMGLLAGV